MMNPSLFLALIAGFVSFLSPCVLPLVPAYIGYMGGRVTLTVAAQSAGGVLALSRPTLGARFSTLLHSLAFVLGFTLVFVTIGLLSTAFVQVIGRQNISAITDVIGRAGGVVIILFGLHLMGVIPALFRWLLARPSSLNSPMIGVGGLVLVALLTTWVFNDWLLAVPVTAGLMLWLAIAGAFRTPVAFWTRVITGLQARYYADTRRQMIAGGQQSYLGSLTMGVVFSAGWTPCIGPIYGAILTMAASGGDVGQAGALLTAYSLGLGIPFVLAALLLDGAGRLLRGLQRHLRTIEFAAGVFLVVIGISVASGRLQSLSQNFAVQFADFSYQLEACTIDLYDGKIDLGGLPGCISEDPAAPS
ncbi:MAG: cytochrome c biogenesis protein CcdA [Chloroflexota bacterium]|nr:cytochrome c biogenesis protein CcdA [Chloroflexota bacterium]